MKNFLSPPECKWYQKKSLLFEAFFRGRQIQSDKYSISVEPGRLMDGTNRKLVESQTTRDQR